jgi:hypothetical protein
MADTALLPQKSDIRWTFLLQGFAGVILTPLRHRLRKVPLLHDEKNRPLRAGERGTAV